MGEQKLWLLEYSSQTIFTPPSFDKQLKALLVTTLCLLNSSSPSLGDILLKQQQLAKTKRKQRPGAASVNPLVQSAVADVGAAKGKWQTVIF